MQGLLSNYYVKLTVLTVILALLFYIIISLFVNAVGIDNFPQFLRFMISTLGAGLLVYKFFAGRVGY